VEVDEEVCEKCGTPASPGAEYCVACGEAFKRKKEATERHEK